MKSSLHEIELDYIEKAVLIRIKNQKTLFFKPEEAKNLAVELLRLSNIAEMDKIERLVYDSFGGSTNARRKTKSKR